MDILILTAAGTLIGFALIVDWCLKKISTQKGKVPFPACSNCGKYMEHRALFITELPIEMEIYLMKWNLPEKVIRRHRCPDGHTQVWIAPPVGDMERSLFVWRRI